MRPLSFRGQRPEEDWAWPQGNFQAGDVLGERQQGHHGLPEGLDRKRGFADAALQRRAGACANQGRGCLRQNSLKPSQKKKAPGSLIAQAAGGRIPNETAPTSERRL